MYQANLELGVLQETNIMDGVYTRGPAGYIVVATENPRQQCDRVAVFYWASLQFLI